MRLTTTTLVIVEDIHDPQSDDMSICYHSFKEDPEAAKSELISDVNALYAPSIVFNSIEEILFGILQLTPEHQDRIVMDLKKHLKSFIQDKDQAEEMITRYTCIYNAIKRWESNHKETEILHQLEISNLLEQLKNN